MLHHRTDRQKKSQLPAYDYLWVLNVSPTVNTRFFVGARTAPTKS